MQQTQLFSPSGDVVWEAQYGSQQLLLDCPVKEVLIEGNRGSAKSDTALVDYLLGVDQGWGSAYRGVVFRNEYKELGDIITKAKDLIPLVFPDARFTSSGEKYVFAGGEELWFRHAKELKNYKTYHGQSFPWMFFDELTNFPDLKFYDAMKSCNRSKVEGIKKRILSATNPHGVNHALVKKRFIDPQPPMKLIKDEYGERMRIHFTFTENMYIFKNDPDYINELFRIQDPVMFQAWVMGNWDIPSGGIFQHIWFRDKHVINLKECILPDHWKMTRSMDWGSSSPFAVCWWKTCPEDQLISWKGGERFIPKGTKFLLSVWYGCVKNKPNTGLELTNIEIAAGIKKHEEDMKYYNVQAGAADSAMFSDGATGTGKSMHDVYEKENVPFVPSKKGAGSRVQRVQVMSDMLHAAKQEHMEDKGLFISDVNCGDFIAQIPDLPRDPKNSEDVDTSCEDHIYDAASYELLNDEIEAGMANRG
jgi:hypothetical protein